MSHIKVIETILLGKTRRLRAFSGRGIAKEDEIERRVCGHGLRHVIYAIASAIVMLSAITSGDGIPSIVINAVCSFK